MAQDGWLLAIPTAINSISVCPRSSTVLFWESCHYLESAFCRILKTQPLLLLRACLLLLLLPPRRPSLFTNYVHLGFEPPSTYLSLHHEALAYISPYLQSSTDHRTGFINSASTSQGHEKRPGSDSWRGRSTTDDDPETPAPAASSPPATGCCCCCFHPGP